MVGVGHRLGWFIVGVWCWSGVAQAGGSSSESGSGSESSGGDSTSDQTTGGESSGAGDTGTGDVSDSDSCGGTCSGDGGVVFDAPMTTDVVSPFIVTVTPLVGCSCDTCGCFGDDATAVTLSLDGEYVGSCSGDGQCTIEVSASVGEHELRATAEYSFHGVSDTMTINVTASEQDGTESDGTASGGTASGGTADGGTSGSDASEGLQDGGSEGCGCTTGVAPRVGAWWLAALAIVAGRRRRPASRRLLGGQSPRNPAANASRTAPEPAG